MTPKSIFLVLLVITIWSSNFIAIKIGVEAIEPLALLTLRFLCAGLIFIPFMKWPGWKQARMIMLVGLLMGPLHQGLMYVALTDITASFASIILQSSVLMTTLIGWFFLKEKIGWRTWAGIFLGFLGVVILVGGSDLTGSITGSIYILASAFFVAAAYIAMKKVHHVHPPTYIALMSLPIFPLIAISSLTIEGTQWWSTLPTLNWPVIATVVLYQAIVLSFSHILWQKLLAHHPVSQMTPWTLLVPLFAVAFAIIFLNEQLTYAIVIGGGLTVLGVSITTFRKLKKSNAAAEPSL